MARLTTKAHLILAILVLGILASAHGAGARSGSMLSRGSLNRKLSKINSKRKHLQAMIRQKNKEHKKVEIQLDATQQRLGSVQARLTRNKMALGRSQDKLSSITDDLKRTLRGLKRRGRLLSGRLIDIYQGDDIGYMDVLLGSRDMKTFVSRGYYVRQIVASDVSLIKEMKRERERYEAQKKAQAAEVRGIAQLQAQLVQDRDEAAGLEAQQQSELYHIEHDTAAYLRQDALLKQNSEEITAQIQAFQSTPRGRRRFAQRFVGNLGLPVNGRISCRFGYRIHPITGVHSLHTGVDIACPRGTPVHSAAAGEVIIAGWMGAYGNTVVIDHGGGVSTLYGHNSVLLVRIGEQVGKGQVIARAGSTGWSTGPHCHFEKRVNGDPVNPM